MIRGLLWLLVFVLSIHVTYTFTSPVIKNRMLEGKMKDIAANRGMRQVPEIRRDVMKFVDEKNIPLPPARLQVSLDGTRCTIAGYYTTQAKLFFVERTYEFFPASHPSVRLKRSS